MTDFINGRKVSKALSVNRLNNLILSGWTIKNFPGNFYKLINAKKKKYSIIVTLFNNSDGPYQIVKIETYRHVNCYFAPSYRYANYDPRYNNPLGNRGHIWFIDNKDVTYKVDQWMKENNIQRPLSKSEQVMLKLEFT